MTTTTAMQTVRDGFKGGDCGYYGERENWLVVIARTRDSRVLETSNFECARVRLEKALPGGCEVELFGHWACGWIEALIVDPANVGAVAEANTIRAELDAYPVLDEGDFSQREWDAMLSLWRGLLPEERVNLCVEFGVAPECADDVERIPDDCDIEEWLRADL